MKKHVLPALGHLRLNAITRGKVCDFLLKKSTDYSRKRVLLFKDVISGVLGWAVDEELIPVNVTNGITKRLWPKSSSKDSAISSSDVLTEEQLQKFLDVCASDFPEWYHFFLLAARTGMRLGELLALRWRDVDFKENLIWVRRTYRRRRYTKPKSGVVRKVDMSPQLADVLRPMCRLVEPDQLVIHKDGKAIEQNKVRTVLLRIFKKAELKPIKMHGLRHTYASLLLSKGVSQ